ncbi:bifunctional 2-polyprenyl-6-hydroxyphenol methylase/3-demethylubiquinol 3-O-methyltransferase UbiG [Streptomyces sp. FH025]|uniref:class I SAM-dependent methyltransferase n=1 Tax=Streptomyces sp. FH025 TaxID=2815937 RepID=UPI001A9EB01E|nr:class I SAM-dependent methyltransferase [Streptomyces sp. FH025]MBO1418154.1 class I SAM-dependent methyltransferase [Streptomyces sp. FH025]
MDSQDWDDRYAASELVWGAAPNQWVVHELAGLAPGHALDLAAGEGRNAIWLAGRGWEVTGLDFSAVALERAERLTAELPDEIADRLTWRHGDARTFEAPAVGYDLVLVAYLQIPAEDRRTALRRAADALAPGGTLLVVGHDLSNLAGGVGGPQDPAVLFTPEDVLADLADRGLRTVRAERVRRTVGGEPGHKGGGEGVAIDALVRLERGAA